MTATGELADWASGLILSDVPDRVVALATSQLVSQLAAIRAGLRHPSGATLVRAFGPLRPGGDPRAAAALLAALGSGLNLDDTAYAGHLSNSTVATPLGYARSCQLDGTGLLTAVLAANECAARVTAAATLGPLRGQSAMFTHLAGGVAGRLRATEAPAERWVDAFGLALSAPPWPVLRGFVGSDAKLLHALVPVRMAMDACDAAEAGLAGPADILEHPDGFLARFATVPLPEVVTAGLGTRWHTETLSFKMRPGGPGVDAAVDCALELHRRLGPITAAQTAEVVVDASVYTDYVARRAESYLAGPRTPVSALLLVTAYPVATALLRGDVTVDDFTAPALEDLERWELAGKVRLRHDPEMTRALLRSIAPFGEALRQAGGRAERWLREFAGPELAKLAEKGDPAADFSRADKATPASVTVRTTDGRTVSAHRDIPVGAAGPDTRRRHAALVRDKFLAQGGPPEVADGLAELPSLDAAELDRLLLRALTVPAGTVSCGSATGQWAAAG